MHTGLSDLDSFGHRESSASRQQGHQPTIMVVDDVKGVCMIAEMFLKEAGYRVIVAASGQECLELYAENGFSADVVVLDYFMPGMDGEQTYAALRARDPNVRVILSSGFLGKRRQAELLENGISAILEKPYMPNQLVGAVRSVLAKAVA